jgi:hypothetical protein
MKSRNPVLVLYAIVRTLSIPLSTCEHVLCHVLYSMSALDWQEPIDWTYRACIVGNLPNRVQWSSGSLRAVTQWEDEPGTAEQKTDVQFQPVTAKSSSSLHPPADRWAESLNIIHSLYTYLQMLTSESGFKLTSKATAALHLICLNVKSSLS